MAVRWLLALCVMSTVVFTPAPLRGQVSPPSNVQAFASGNDIVVRWWGDAGADSFVAQLDTDPFFGSPATWTVRALRGVQEIRLRDLAPGTYFVRVRAQRSFLVVSLGSGWSPVRRVDVRPLLGVAPAFLSFGNLPRVGEVRFFGDDLLLFLLPGAVAQPALVEIDNDVGFGHPFLVPVEGFRDRRVVLVRGVPRNRFFVRVVPRTVVVREVHPTTVVVVNDRVADGAGFRRQVDFQQGSAVKKVLVREEDAKGEHGVAVQRTVVFNRDADMNDGKGPGKKQVAQADKRSDHGKGKKRDD